MTTEDLQQRDYAQTLARGLACLEVLADADDPLRSADLAKALGLHRATTRRILMTLETLGYVSQAGGRYGLTARVLGLGRGVLRGGGLWTLAGAEVADLANELDEPSSIAVLDGAAILFVARDAARRIYSSRLGIGDRLPAHCSAIGKVLLAGLPEAALERWLETTPLAAFGPRAITDPALLRVEIEHVRAQGFAVADEEMEAGTRSIAVPLRRSEGATVAGLSVATQAARLSVNRLIEVALPPLRAHAARIDALIADFERRQLPIP